MEVLRLLFSDVHVSLHVGCDQNAWENEQRQKGNSLVKYFSSWKQMQKLKTAHTNSRDESEEEEEEEEEVR